MQLVVPVRHRSRYYSAFAFLLGIGTSAAYPSTMRVLRHTRSALARERAFDARYHSPWPRSRHRDQPNARGHPSPAWRAATRLLRQRAADNGAGRHRARCLVWLRRNHWQEGRRGEGRAGNRRLEAPSLRRRGHHRRHALSDEREESRLASGLIPSRSRSLSRWSSSRHPGLASRSMKMLCAEQGAQRSYLRFALTCVLTYVIFSALRSGCRTRSDSRRAEGRHRDASTLDFSEPRRRCSACTTTLRTALFGNRFARRCAGLLVLGDPHRALGALGTWDRLRPRAGSELRSPIKLPSTIRHKAAHSKTTSKTPPAHGRLPRRRRHVETSASSTAREPRRRLHALAITMMVLSALLCAGTLLDPALAITKNRNPRPENHHALHETRRKAQLSSSSTSRERILSFPTAHPSGPVLEKAGRLARAFRQKRWPVVLVNVAGGAPAVPTRGR